MKQLFLFLLMAAGIATASCKKDKKPAPEPGPVYTGAQNAVSGVWSMDIYTLSSIAPFRYDYGFGTNQLYEKITGSSTDKKVEKGRYTLAPVSGTPDAYTIQLQPVTGNAYTIKVTELSETHAIFEQSEPYTKFGFRRN